MPCVRAFVAALVLVVSLLPVPAKSQVKANPGDNLNVDGQTIETTTATTPALWAAGGTITGTGTTASTTGLSSEGALADSGGQITLTNSSISTTNLGDSFGLRTIGAGSSIAVTNTTVTTQGIGVHAVQNDGGSITISGGSITTNGDGADGLIGNAGTITTSGTTITLNGAGAVAAWATSPASIGLTNTTIILNGAKNYGLFSNFKGTVTMNGGSITATGDNSIGAYSGGSFGSGIIDMTGVTVQLQGTGQTGLKVDLGSVMTFANGSVTVQGAGAFGLLMNGNSDTNTLTVSGSTVTAPDGTTIGFQGNQGTINFTNGSTVTGGAGGLMLVKHLTDPTNPGVATLTADNSTLTGDITLDGAAANTADITLRNNATLTGDINVDTANGAFADLAVQSGAIFTGATQDVRNVTTSGGTWNVTADSTVTGTLTNGGLVSFVSGGPFKTLTTTNYVGNGGTLTINTALGDSSSPTDQLIVNNGTISGVTGITVNNAGGTGDVTLGNGIPIVVAQGTTTSDPTAFTLTKAVTAGAYIYALLRGQSGTTQELNSWYLCSTTDCLNAGGQTGPGGPFIPPLGPPPLPPGQPLYHGGTPMQSLYGTMARQLGLLTLGTFHERNGDQRLADTGGRERTWARIFGEHTEQAHGGTVRPSFDGDFVGLQGGADLWQFASLPGHRDNVGLFAAYTEGRAHVSGLVFAMPGLFAGSTDFNATSLGAYWSHIAPAAGWYTDAVLMGTLYDGDGRTRHATDVGVEGSGVIASFEGGFTLARFMGFKLEPQAQLVYQYINLDEAHHANSSVDHHTPDALHGRIGLRLAADQLPWLLRPYLKANIWQDFVGSDRTTYGGVTELVLHHRATTLELGGGFTAQISPNVALWASADWSTDIGGNEQERESVSGNAGLRIVW